MPRLRPDLEVSRPADAAGQVRVPVPPELWEVLFTGGERHLVHVRAWRKDVRGRDVIDVEWRADGGTWSDSFLANPAKMREIR